MQKYVDEVFMIHEDLNQKWGSVKVVPPQHQSTNNSKGFPIIDVIVMFCGGE